MMTLLDEKRLEINDIDTQLVQLFEQRMHAVESIIQYKLEHQLPILDTGREAENILILVSLYHASFKRVSERNQRETQSEIIRITCMHRKKLRQLT